MERVATTDKCTCSSGFSLVKLRASEQLFSTAPLALPAQLQSPDTAVVGLDAGHLPEEGGVTDHGHNFLFSIKEPLHESLDARHHCRWAQVLPGVPLVQLGVLQDSLLVVQPLFLEIF